MKCVYSTWAPYFLRAEEMELCCSECLENLAGIIQYTDFLSRVIIVDKSQIHHYNPVMGDQSVKSLLVTNHYWEMAFLTKFLIIFRKFSFNF